MEDVEKSHGYLVNIMSVPEIVCQKIDDVEIVREYLDVFPDDVVGIPPERGWNFPLS